MKEQANNRTSNHWLDYDGQHITVNQASQMYGISAHRISQRLRDGWSVERALTEPEHNTNKVRDITWNGKTQRLCDWAKELNISYSTLQNRLNLHGWSIEKAFTTPVITRKKAN